MSKTVVLTKITPKSVSKKIVGELLQDALDHLKVIITDRSGLRSIKCFKKSTYVYKILED